ncbi:MAG: RNA pseudouridine synthase [Pseudomonadales bacterium]|nr:RNA pseudouridine synthase [Pseudomonadales bacterium]MBO7006566.1 RNA pseudouridine synthase [Pseudomonadales bacterium]
MAAYSFTKTIKATPEYDVATQLSDATGLSRTAIKDVMAKGAVWSDKSGRKRRLRRASTKLKSCAEISIYYSEDVIHQTPPDPTLQEDQYDFSIWMKPPGLMSSGSRFGDHCAIERIVEKTLDRPTFLVHRLDRFVWGLMVLAHSKKAATDLSTQFQNRETRKVYKAVVHGLITDPCTISVPIDGKDAVSHIQPITPGSERSLIEVDIETGRKHQIRKHLASIGHPIVGDRQYGLPDEQGIQLASVALGFKNLEGFAVEYRLPKDLEPSLNS